MVWTEFMDMHSGGSKKLKWSYIFIEAPESKAEIIFQNRFGRNPHRVTCTCCGSDYSLTGSNTLDQITAFNRGCKYQYFNKEGKRISDSEGFVIGKGIIKGCYTRYIEEGDKEGYRSYIPLKDYIQNKDILIIRKKDINSKERIGTLNKEGYVWK